MVRAGRFRSCAGLARPVLPTAACRHWAPAHRPAADLARLHHRAGRATSRRAGKDLLGPVTEVRRKFRDVEQARHEVAVEVPGEKDGLDGYTVAGTMHELDGVAGRERALDHHP